MDREDAHGGELLTLILNAHNQSQGIIGQISAHAPMVAQQLSLLDMHYTEIWKAIEKELRMKTNRPERELIYLEILEEFNRLVGNHGARTDIERQYIKAGVVYGQGYWIGGGPLPDAEYMTSEGLSKVVSWTAHHTADGRPYVRECLENGQDIVTMLQGEIIEPMVLKVADFAMLVTGIVPAAQVTTDKFHRPVPTWTSPRVCYTSKQIDNEEIYRTLGFRYKPPQDKTGVRIEFDYSHPFTIDSYLANLHEDTLPQHRTVWQTSVRNAVVMSAQNDRYALIFYSVPQLRNQEMIVFDRRLGEVVPVQLEYDLENFVRNTFPFFDGVHRFPMREQQLTAMKKVHHYTTLKLPYEYVPDVVKAISGVKACHEIVFDKPTIVQNTQLELLTKMLAYSVESEKDGITHKLLPIYEPIDPMNVHDVR